MVSFVFLRQIWSLAFVFQTYLPLTSQTAMWENIESRINSNSISVLEEKTSARSLEQILQLAEKSTQIPEETTTETPPPRSIWTPEETSTQTPAQTSTQKPVQTSTQTPAQTSTQKPVQTSTQTSVQTSTWTPEEISTQTSTQTPVKTAGTTATSKKVKTPSKKETTALVQSTKVYSTSRPKKTSKNPPAITVTEKGNHYYCFKLMKVGKVCVEVNRYGLYSELFLMHNGKVWKNIESVYAGKRCFPLPVQKGPFSSCIYIYKKGKELCASLHFTSTITHQGKKRPLPCLAYLDTRYDYKTKHNYLSNIWNNVSKKFWSLIWG